MHHNTIKILIYEYSKECVMRENPDDYLEEYYKDTTNIQKARKRN